MQTARKPYTTDVSDEEWSFAAPYLCLLPLEAGQRQHDYDKDIYKARGLIECFFAKLKQFRRVATRYDKLLANFMGFVKLAAIAIWLR